MHQTQKHARRYPYGGPINEYAARPSADLLHHLRRVLAQMMQQVSAWARGVFINGAAVGISTGVLLSLVHVQPALVFGVLAFLGEFVPMIGSVIAAIPALFVAASLGPTTLA